MNVKRPERTIDLFHRARLPWPLPQRLAHLMKLFWIVRQSYKSSTVVSKQLQFLAFSLQHFPPEPRDWLQGRQSMGNYLLWGRHPPRLQNDNTFWVCCQEACVSPVHRGSRTGGSSWSSYKVGKGGCAGKISCSGLIAILALECNVVFSGKFLTPKIA